MSDDPFGDACHKLWLKWKGRAERLRLELYSEGNHEKADRMMVEADTLEELAEAMETELIRHKQGRVVP